MLGKARPVWLKVIESEQRMSWLKSMIRKRLLVRDISSFLKSQGEKLRSEEEKIKEEERDLLLGLMNIKLKDEKKHYRRLVRDREDMRKMLKKECESKEKKYITVIRKLRREVAQRKEELKEKYRRKIEHLNEIRKKEEMEKREVTEIPDEIEQFRSCVIFDRERFAGLKKANIDKLTIGKVKIDEDEKAALRLHPNFAVMNYLDEEEQERDVELGLAKLRMEARNIEERKKIGDIEYEGLDGKRIKLDAEIEDREKEKERELSDAKERQIFDPINKVFDFSKRRVTDMKENSKVHLPKPLKASDEGEIEMIREVLMGEFKKYKLEQEEKFEMRKKNRESKNKNKENMFDKKEREKRENRDVDLERKEELDRNIKRKETEKIIEKKKDKNRNQEGKNLTPAERRGLQKLRERIKEGEIVILKTDKSGKMMVSDKEEYLKMGKGKIESDRKLDRADIRKIEERINNHTRILTKIFNISESLKHLKTVQDSVITHSETSAPM